ncbi:2-keto-3-deoxy-galactonokinase [Bradyrhizobium sp. LB13.1]
MGAVVKDGTVAHFSTFMTGELFSVVSRETILSLAVAGADDAEDVASFKAAVKAAYEAPAFTANLLFTARSRQLLFEGTPAAARETVSGTLIGVELAAGLSGVVPRAGVTLIASGRLAMLYRLAFEALSVTAMPIDADEAVRRGLSMAAAAIWTK